MSHLIKPGDTAKLKKNLRKTPYQFDGTFLGLKIANWFERSQSNFSSMFVKGTLMQI